ncbi:hypothetical protein [Roseobacter sp.]|uniref:glycosyltransferase n=1 Tax=Roseobacter sp. TaxID=1907202 RepID=UPI0025DD64B2|nr:hypothetical protein [Roseobacter sp.]
MTPTIAYVTDPRFPGGTSSAIAAELAAISDMVRPAVYGLSTAMFRDREDAPVLTDALAALNLTLIRDPEEIAADIVIFHNPACLKFQNTPGTRIIARHLIVVTHENFLRPGGHEAFDVANCLDQIAGASVALTRSLAPVSDANRSTVSDWMDRHPAGARWQQTQDNWPNICDFDLIAPTARPADRRGRHSRPGFEKFPSRETMDLCFPSDAASSVILGADHLADDPDRPPHWTLIPFQGLSVAQYFDMIDFMVYYTAPTWHESFGRVLAEAIAAGKIVITDPGTAQTFQGGVKAATPDEVSDIIAGYIADPDRYQADVRAGQRSLDAFSAAAFRRMFSDVLSRSGEAVL